MDAGLSGVDVDPNDFEPQLRARSNTWPCRPVEDFGDGHQSSPNSDDHAISDHTKDALGIKQKTSSRRNAWGNLSYADLITKAIQSSPEQRLTLSQIYDWMVQNVPYFKDKGDNTSSAGWKNSIRHNLSLHSRFMRIQNEGTGKSSWWVINPDAKPGKAPRRRAGSMETKSLEKKRGRIKKRIEAIRAAQENGTLNSEDFADCHYNSSLSPEFRGRTGSNASSCGRLSPIQAAVEPDLHDSQVPPMSPIPWASELDGDDDFVNTNSNESFSLVDSLVGGLNLKESGNLAGDQNDVEMNTLKQQLMSGGSMIRYNTGNSFDEGGYGSLPAPPSYSDHLQQQNSQRTVLNLDTMTASRNYTNLSNISSKQPMEVYTDNVMTPPMLSQNRGSPGPNSLGVNVSPQLNSPARSPQLSPSNYGRGSYSPQPMKRSPQQQQMMSPPVNQQQQQQQQQQMGGGGNRSLLQQCLEAPNDSMLRQALTQQMNPTYHSQQQSGPSSQLSPAQMQYMQYNPAYTRAALQTMSPGLNNINNNVTMGQLSSITSRGPIQRMSQMPQMGGTQGSISNSSLSEIDTENMLDLDYDYEQLLRQELALDPSLDFNFESNPSTQNVPTSDNQNLVQ